MRTSAFLDALYVSGLAAAWPYLAYRLLADKGYRSGFGERCGRVPASASAQPLLWLHCSSVGEALLVRRLVPALEAAVPGWSAALSCSTETGYDTAARQFAGHGVFRHPFDLSWVVRRTLRALHPRALILVEREVWPQLVLAAAEADVPVALVNARRFSQRSWRAYRRLGGIAQRVFQAISLYLVQGERDAEFFRSASGVAGRVEVAGNLKYDNVLVARDEAGARALRQRLGWPDAAAVFVAGSTHEGEESTLLEAFTGLRARWPDLKLVLAPRYPRRAGRVAELLRSAGLRCSRWSTLKVGAAVPVEVPEAVLVDTLGDLPAFYALASVAFVGGSLIAHGGHNVIEPAAQGRPVLVGPHVENTAEAVEFLLAAGALRVVKDAPELAAALGGFLSDEGAARAAGQSAQEAIRSRQGACERHVKSLVSWLTVSRSTKERAENGWDQDA